MIKIRNLYNKFNLRIISAVICTTLVSSCAYESYPVNHSPYTHGNHYNHGPYGSSRTVSDPTIPLILGASAIGAIAYFGKKNHDKRNRSHHYNHRSHRSHNAHYNHHNRTRADSIRYNHRRNNLQSRERQRRHTSSNPALCSHAKTSRADRSQMVSNNRSRANIIISDSPATRESSAPNNRSRLAEFRANNRN